jgi:hypothetical protein
VAINAVPESFSDDPISKNRVSAGGSLLPVGPTIVPARAIPPKRNAVNRGVEWMREAASAARGRVRYAAEHYPLQLIISLGAAAFVGGVALRIWRSNRYARNQNFFRKWRA